MEGIQLFNESITGALVKNRRFLLKRPAYIKTFAGISKKIKRQARIRNSYDKKEGVVVPPVLIVSVTNDCNLSCRGCYACGQQRSKPDEMELEQLSRILDEAIGLGVAMVMIAGGEPLLKEGIIDLPARHPDTLYVMFTNGLLLDALENRLPDNLVPVLSLEGGRESTDARRGAGMYEKVMAVMKRLDDSGRLFGASVTLTSKNYDEVIKSGYLEKLESKGCRAAFLIEYVPYEGRL